jgi:hypothetical protein
MADATGQFWPITIFGYVLQMASVPALALVDSWPAAAVLIVLERVGKAIRNPPRDVMLSHAAKRVGDYGWVFGMHEALDQFGALFGPLAVAAVLAHRGSYHLPLPSCSARPSSICCLSRSPVSSIPVRRNSNPYRRQCRVRDCRTCTGYISLVPRWWPRASPIIR